MSLERRRHRRREKLGLNATRDHLRCLGRNFTEVAIMHGTYLRGFDDGQEAAIEEVEKLTTGAPHTFESYDAAHLVDYCRHCTLDATAPAHGVAQ